MGLPDWRKFSNTPIDHGVVLAEGLLDEKGLSESCIAHGRFNFTSFSDRKGLVAEIALERSFDGGFSFILFDHPVKAGASYIINEPERAVHWRVRLLSISDGYSLRYRFSQ